MIASPNRLVLDVSPAWIDYNQHMNVAYYSKAYDAAFDAVLDHLEIGKRYAESTPFGIYAMEAHTAFMREVKAGSRIEIVSFILERDGAKIRTLQLLSTLPDRIASSRMEMVSVHVDRRGPRIAPFSAAQQARIDEFGARTRAELPPDAILSHAQPR
jgi:acyl-CoA thioester hydrolase